MAALGLFEADERVERHAELQPCVPAVVTRSVPPFNTMQRCVFAEKRAPTFDSVAPDLGVALELNEYAQYDQNAYGHQCHVPTFRVLGECKV